MTTPTLTLPTYAPLEVLHCRAIDEDGGSPFRFVTQPGQGLVNAFFTQGELERIKDCGDEFAYVQELLEERLQEAIAAQNAVHVGRVHKEG